MALSLYEEIPIAADMQVKNYSRVYLPNFNLYIYVYTFYNATN